MKRYVLKDESGSLHYKTDSLSNIMEMLDFVRSKGCALDDFTVIKFDTESLPPVYITAKDVLKRTESTGGVIQPLLLSARKLQKRLPIPFLKKK